MVSVSIGADVRKILRRFIHFEHPRHDETRIGMFLWGVGVSLPDKVWGEAPAGPAANSFFVFFWRNETHSRHKNANYWRLVAGRAQGQNIGDEGLRA